MFAHDQTEDALVIFDRRLARGGRILQPMGKDVADLKTGVSVLKRRQSL